MAMDCPYINFMAIYIISASLLGTNSGRGVTHWKINEQGSSIVQGNESDKNYVKTDPVFALLIEHYPPKIVAMGKPKTGKNKSNKKVAGERGLSSSVKTRDPPAYEIFQSSTFHCGDPVNETIYDKLPGIENRKTHPLFPEPEVEMIFKKSEIDQLDTKAIEENLKSSLEESPMSVVLCNQIGNYLRMKGNTYHAIECFRKALYTAPNNADILLNLARVLYNLKYVEDAITLTKRSLEMQPANLNCWLQHFTLGEMLKANGEKKEAVMHFRHALVLNPSFKPAESQLEELGTIGDESFDFYTYLIIGFLVAVVLFWLYITSPGKEQGSQSKPPMRSKVLTGPVRRSINRRL